MDARRTATARRVAAALSLFAATAALAQPQPEGFLCCNMRSDGKWISDINYAESPQVVPVGTPAKVTGYGRYRVLVVLNGSQNQAIGNDYSRDIALPDFAKRYVVAEDPKQKLATFPQATRKAIEEGKLRVGMTREQVLMAVGYPVSSENPSLDAPVWRYWRSSFAEYQVHFDSGGKVTQVLTDDMTKALVVAP